MDEYLAVRYMIGFMLGLGLATVVSYGVAYLLRPKGDTGVEDERRIIRREQARMSDREQ